MLSFEIIFSIFHGIFINVTININKSKYIINGKKLVLFFTFLILTIIALLAIRGKYLIYRDGPYTGTVIDTETGEPIEGAIVVAEWIVRKTSVGGPVYVYLDAKETLTDKNGNFSIKTFWNVNLDIIGSLTSPTLIVFKPGYKEFFHLRPSSSNRTEQLDRYSNIELQKLDNKEQRINTLKIVSNELFSRMSFFFMDHSPLFEEEKEKRKNLIKLIHDEEENLEVESIISVTMPL